MSWLLQNASPIGIILLLCALLALAVYLKSRITVEPDILDISPFEVHVKITGSKWIVYHCDHYQSLQDGRLVPGKHNCRAVPTNGWFQDEGRVFPHKPDEPGPWFFVDPGWTDGLPYSHGYSSRDEAIRQAVAFQSYMEDLA